MNVASLLILVLHTAPLVFAPLPTQSREAPRVISKIYSPSASKYWLPEEFRTYYRLIRKGALDPHVHKLLSRGAVLTTKPVTNLDDDEVGEIFVTTMSARTHDYLCTAAYAIGLLCPTLTLSSLAEIIAHFTEDKVYVGQEATILSVGLKAHHFGDVIDIGPGAWQDGFLVIPVQIHRKLKRSNNVFPYIPVVSLSLGQLPVGRYSIKVVWQLIPDNAHLANDGSTRLVQYYFFRVDPLPAMPR